MRSLNLSLLLLFASLPACTEDGGSIPEATSTGTQESSSYQPGRPGSEVGYPAEVVTSNPFSGESRGPDRVQQLPSDPFFQENYYPDSAVIDVKRIFGSPTVLLVSPDPFEAIDAFYAKKFTAADGTLQGRPGSYYRMSNGGGMERVQIEEADAGGYKIVLQL